MTKQPKKVTDKERLDWLTNRKLASCQPYPADHKRGYRDLAAYKWKDHDYEFLWGIWVRARRYLKGAKP